MTPTPQSVSGATARADAMEQGKPQADAGPFVLNLCSSTTPMALAKSEQPELKRFSFFVSRRFEEGRERFRLHMGYFATLSEAEEWLGAVRDIYPGAWAGEAPGKKLRERAVAAAAAQAQHAAGPPPVPTLPVSRPEPVAVQVPVMNVPTIHAATPAPTRAATPVPAPRNVPVARPAAVMLNSTAPKQGPAAARSPQPSLPSAIGMMRSPSAPRSVPAPRGAPPAPPMAPARSVATSPTRSAPPLAMQAAASASASAARSALAAAAANMRGAPTQASAARTAPATTGGRTVQPPRAAAPSATGHQPKAPAQTASPRAQGLTAPAQRQGATAAAQRPGATAPAQRQAVKPTAKSALPNSNVREVLKALGEAPSETTGETRMMPAPVLANLDAADDVNFSDTQVLKFLETRRADGTEITGIDVETGAISLLKPDDTGTRRALKEAVTENAPVWFAVQLQWSVQPVEVSKVPPLAIFSAYTLYTVEGSRDGRKWFGLRLGFFSDAISAKQVAYYVRSEFTSVAVVPVSPQERTRASDVDKKGAGQMAFPKRTRSGPVEEFKLIDSDDAPSAPLLTPTRQMTGAVKPGLTARAAAPPPPAPARRTPKSGSRVRAREQRGPQTLEETLEILGAGELEMDNGNGETMNESGVRHLRVEVQKNTPFGRLLERLSDRVRKS